MDRSRSCPSSWAAAVAILALIQSPALLGARPGAGELAAGPSADPRQDPARRPGPGPAPDPLPELPPQGSGPTSPATEAAEDPPAPPGSEPAAPAASPPATEPPDRDQGEREDAEPAPPAPTEDPRARLPAPDPLPLDLGPLPADLGAPGDTGGEARPAPARPRGRVERAELLPPGPLPPPGRLATRLELRVAGHPVGVLAGDADGDGRAEVVAACRAPGSLHVWTDLGATPRPEPAPRVTPIGDFPVGPVWLAADREAPHGRVAVASRSTHELTVHELDRAAPGGTRLAWSRSLPAAPRVLASGDLGANGTQDLVVVTAADELLVFAADGTTAVRAPLAESHATCAHVLESGAGVVIGFQESRRITWYRLAPGPDGPRILPRESWTLDGPPRRVIESDVDGDGDRELVVVGAERTLLVFGLHHRGARDAWLHREAPPPLRVETGEVPIDVETLDLDADGDRELVVLSHSALHVETFEIVGEALERCTSAYAGQAPWDLAAADVDGDGAIDLALALPGARRVALILGAKDGSLAVPRVTPVDLGPHALALGDLDGDGRADAFVLSSLRDTRAVLLAREGGELVPEGAPEPAGPGASRPSLADLDGDGHLDAAYLVREAGGVALVSLFGDGAGHLSPRPETPPVPLGREIGDLELADVDADGTVDAVVSDPADGAVRVTSLANLPGGGVAWDAPRRTKLPGGPRGVTTLDLDGDGDLEVLIALSGPQPVAGVAALDARATPDGGIELVHLTTVHLAGAPFDVTVADFDGDGLPEPAVLARASEHSLEGFVTPWWRTEHGAWTVGERLVTGLRPYVLRAGDLDGDGRADLLVSAQNSHHVNAWLARPEMPSGFARLADLGAGRGCLDLALGDLDGDWRLDVVVANAFSNDVTTILQR